MQPTGRLWLRLVTHHKVIRSYTFPCTFDETEQVLMEELPALDLSQPMWLDRHRTDWEQFALCTFRPEHFMEAVPFDQMLLSFIPDENSQARPPRPRNPLEDV